MLVAEDFYDRLRKAALALLESVSFDDSGTIVGGQYQGGNGGLISRETIKKADDLRRLLGEHARA